MTPWLVNYRIQRQPDTYIYPANCLVKSGEGLFSIS